MARQPFRQGKSDGTMEEAGGGVPASFGIKALGQFTDHEYWKTFQAFNADSYSNGYTLNYFASHNNYYLYPLTVPRTGTLDKMHCRCMTAGASGDEITLALYPSDANGTPSSQAAAGGPTAFDVSSTGYLSVTSIDLDVEAGDIVWFALRPAFGSWPGTCKLQGTINGIPTLSGRVMGYGATSAATLGVSRYGPFTGAPPSTHSESWTYIQGYPTSRFILMWLQYE